MAGFPVIKTVQNNLINLFYVLKKIIPRGLQIAARRRIAKTKRSIYRKTWPIDQSASLRPARFTGWPGGKRFALVLRHDVETEFGTRYCRNILAVEKRYGMRSAFYFVPGDYRVDESLRRDVADAGCEIGIQGFTHDGTLYSSRSVFLSQAAAINSYLRLWNAEGFASPSSHHRFDWIHDLAVKYDTSSFDTDPFEPQPDGIKTIFPLVINSTDGHSYVEIPYTLPQDFTLFVILRQEGIGIWKRKLDWIAEKGGMAFVVTHPDYMQFPGSVSARYSYPSDLYAQFLSYVEEKYAGHYWHALPREMAGFWNTMMGMPHTK